MSDTDSSGFGKFVPGFEFMQNLAKQAAGGLVQGVQQTVPQLPNLSSWVAPTFNVEDLEKRIQELKAVHFWLDQNARALGATIQALEVQKMTLATLQGMNVSLGDVANALKIKATDTMAGMAGFAGMGGQPVPVAAPAAPVSPYAASFASAPAPSVSPPPAPAEPAASPSTTAADFVRASMFPFGAMAPAPQAAAAEPVAPPPPPPAPAPAPVAADAKPPAGVVDPMQWWGALTQQFQAIATNALGEASAQTAVDAGKNITSALAREAVKSASEMTAGLTRGLVGTPAAARESARQPSQTGKASVASKLTKAAGAVASKTASQATATAVKAVGGVAAKAAKAAASAPSASKPTAKAATGAKPKAAVKPATKATAKTTAKAPARRGVL